MSTTAATVSAERPRVFYGWWVVAAAAVGGLIGGPPLVVFSFPVYFRPLSEHFHAGRGAISLAFTCFNLTQAVFSPAMGWLVDRVGARRVILSSVGLLGGALVGAKLLGSSMAMLYLFFVVLGLATSGSGFPCGVVVSHWFDRKRGLALGCTMLGTGTGAMLMPAIAQRTIAAFGWRTAYAFSGCAVLLVTLPLLSIVLRGDPREMGLLPDGAKTGDGGCAKNEPAEQEGLSWSETWRRREFWMLLAAFFLASASLHACFLHMGALLTDRGVSVRDAALASSLLGMALLLTRFVVGYLLDRIFAPRLAMWFFLGTSAGIALLLAGALGALAFAAAFLVGMGLGAEGDLIAYSLTRYFGLKAFGTAYGTTFAVFLVAGALGAYLMGAAFDRYHSYTLPLGGFLLAMAASAGVLALMGPYRFAAARKA